MHSARFELARVAPADLESAALDRSATNALVINIPDQHILKGLTQFQNILIQYKTYVMSF